MQSTETQNARKFNLQKHETHEKFFHTLNTISISPLTLSILYISQSIRQHQSQAPTADLDIKTSNDTVFEMFFFFKFFIQKNLPFFPLVVWYRNRYRQKNVVSTLPVSASIGIEFFKKYQYRSTRVINKYVFYFYTHFQHSGVHQTTLVEGEVVAELLHNEYCIIQLLSLEKPMHVIEESAQMLLSVPIAESFDIC